MIKEQELGKKYYNIRNHHYNHWSLLEDKEKVKKTISEKTKESMWRPEVREKYVESLKTRDCRSSDPEVREKRRKSMIGKNAGKDNSKAVRISADMRRGKPLSEEHKSKIKEITIFKDINKKKIKCRYCNFEGNLGNISRYHNERCKIKNVNV